MLRRLAELIWGTRDESLDESRLLRDAGFRPHPERAGEWWRGPVRYTRLGARSSLRIERAQPSCLDPGFSGSVLDDGRVDVRQARRRRHTRGGPFRAPPVSPSGARWLRAVAERIVHLGASRAAMRADAVAGGVEVTAWADERCVCLVVTCPRIETTVGLRLAALELRAAMAACAAPP